MGQLVVHIQRLLLLYSLIILIDAHHAYCIAVVVLACYRKGCSIG